MAEAKKAPRRRKTETVRQKADKEVKAKAKPKRSAKAAKTAIKPIGSAKDFLTSEVKAHDHDDSSKVKSTLTKSRGLTPSYFKNSFNELRQVTWPTFKEALRLTGAVFVFSAVFSAIVAGLDWVLDRGFQEVILNESQNIKDFFNNLF